MVAFSLVSLCVAESLSPVRCLGNVGKRLNLGTTGSRQAHLIISSVVAGGVCHKPSDFWGLHTKKRRSARSANRPHCADRAGRGHVEPIDRSLDQGRLEAKRYVRRNSPAAIKNRGNKPWQRRPVVELHGRIEETRLTPDQSAIVACFVCWWEICHPALSDFCSKICRDETSPPSGELRADRPSM
jgi:hypothetical protein